MVDDYFARIGIPQSVVVDGVTLKDAWHRAAAVSGENGEEINRAYAVLRDPAKRIEHLLTLHGQKATGSEKPGATLFDLFFTVGAALKKADEIVTRISEAATALQRAGLTDTLLANLDELALTNSVITNEKKHRLAKLESLDSDFPNISDLQWTTLAALGNDFTFLTKWESEIQKRETQLQETLMGKIV